MAFSFTFHFLSLFPFSIIAQRCGMSQPNQPSQLNLYKMHTIQKQHWNPPQLQKGKISLSTRVENENENYDNFTRGAAVAAVCLCVSCCVNAMTVLNIFHTNSPFSKWKVISAMMHPEKKVFYPFLFFSFEFDTFFTHKMICLCSKWIFRDKRYCIRWIILKWLTQRKFYNFSRFPFCLSVLLSCLCLLFIKQVALITANDYSQSNDDYPTAYIYNPLAYLFAKNKKIKYKIKNCAWSIMFDAFLQTELNCRSEDL